MSWSVSGTNNERATVKKTSDDAGGVMCCRTNMTQGPAEPMVGDGLEIIL